MEHNRKNIEKQTKMDFTAGCMMTRNKIPYIHKYLSTNNRAELETTPAMGFQINHTQTQS
jgi:hypothetical protein